MSRSHPPLSTVARGLGLFLTGVLGAAAAAIALDTRLDLPAAARGLVFAGWLVLAVGLAHKWVIAPLSRPTPEGEWAAAGRAAGETLLAALLTAGFFGVALLLPGAGDRARRFVLPWYVPADYAPYRLVVPSGDVTVPHGEPLTLTAYLEPERAGAALPETAVLVIRPNGSGLEERAPLPNDGSAAFAWTRPTTDAGFEYRVEAGPTASSWYTVRVSRPVELADGTRVVVWPPANRTDMPPRTVSGFGPVGGQQYGTARFEFAFSRRPADARLDFVSADADRREERVPVEFGRDGHATATLRLTRDGTLTLTATDEAGLRTRWTSAVQVTPDAPPRVVTLTGLTARPTVARPGDRVPIGIEATDDYRVTGVWLEQHVIGTQARDELLTVPTRPLGRTGAAGQITVTMPNAVGAEVWLRVRVADDSGAGESHMTLFPPTGWAVVKVSDAAAPAAEQNLLAVRAAAGDRLAGIQTALSAARQALNEVGRPADNDPLSPEQLVRLRTAADAADGAVRQASTLADELGLVPDLRPLAAAVRRSADGPLLSAGRVLRSMTDAETFRADARRGAEQHLTDGTRHLQHLGRISDSAHQARLDRLALGQFAASLHGSPDVTAVRQRFNELIHRSPGLRAAVAAGAADETRELAVQLRRVVDQLAALNEASAATEALARRLATAGPVARQTELDGTGAELIARYALPIRLADAGPLTDLSTDRARPLIGRDSVAALTAQEKAAAEAERVAEALGRAAAARTDPRESARQLARWQTDLGRRATDSAADGAGRQRLADEQLRLLKAAQSLATCSDDTEVLAAHRQAVIAVTTSETAIRRGTTELPAAVKDATEQMARFAARVPDLDGRRRTATARLKELRRRFDDLGRECEQAARDGTGSTAGDRLGLLAARLTDLATELETLDLPNQSERQAEGVASLGRAADDLRAGHRLDVSAALLDARHRLDWLAVALGGGTPADELALRAAGQLRAAEERTSSLDDRPTAADVGPIRAALADAGKALRGIPPADGGALLADAKEAVDAAELAAGRPDSGREVRRRLAVARSAVDSLAGRLTGSESPGERVAGIVRRRSQWGNRFEKPPTLPATVRREADAALAQDLESLEQTRVGRSQEAKQAALVAIRRAAVKGDTSTNRAAAEAVRRLAEAMARSGDGYAPTARVGPPAPDRVSDPFRDLGDFLPTREAAAAFHELARKQRAVRDETAAVVTRLARGPAPGADELAPLVSELVAIQKSAGRWVNQTADGRTPASLLGDGSVREAVSAAGRLVEALLGAGRPDAVRLADRLTEVMNRANRFAERPDVQAARQRTRRSELASELERIQITIRVSADLPATDPTFHGPLPLTVDELLGRVRAALSSGSGPDNRAAAVLLQIGCVQLDAQHQRLRPSEAVTNDTTKAGVLLRRARRALAAGDESTNLTLAAELIEQAARILPICPPIVD